MSTSAITIPFRQMSQSAQSPCIPINNTGKRMLPAPENPVIASQENVCSRSIKVVSGSNNVSLKLQNTYNEHRLMAGCRERNRAIIEEELRNQPTIINHTFVDKSEHPYKKRKLLSFAIKIGNADIVSVLLQRGADAHQRNNFGSTALHLATEKGNIKIVHTLLKAKIDINAEDNDGDTPLHLAAYYKDTAIFDALIDKGANVNKLNHRGLAPLHIIAEYGPLAAALKLVTNGALIDLQNKEGSMPLHLASHHGRAEIVKILLDHGADPNLKNTNGEEPMYLATCAKQRAVIRTLADKVDINETLKGGMNALQYSAHQWNHEIVQLLVNLNANIGKAKFLAHRKHCLKIISSGSNIAKEDVIRFNKTISILKDASKNKKNCKRREKAQPQPVVPEISEPLLNPRAMERQPLLQNSMQQNPGYDSFDNQGFDWSERPSPKQTE